MSNEQNSPQEGNPLNADEIREKACSASVQDKRLFYTDVKSYMLGFYAGYDHVFNQGVALREELEAVKKERDKYKNLFNQQPEPIEHAELRESLSEVTRQRDEAVKLLVEFKQKIGLPPPAIAAIDHITAQYKKDGKCYSSTGNCVNSNVCQGLDHCMYHSGLSSGETKPSFFTLERCLEVFNNGFTCGMMNKIGHAGYEREDVTDRMRVSLIKEINPLNNLSNSQKSPWERVQYKADKWDHYRCTLSFLLFHDDFSYSIGSPYEFTDGGAYPKISVTHYMPLPTPPESLTDKSKV